MDSYRAAKWFWSKWTEFFCGWLLLLGRGNADNYVAVATEIYIESLRCDPEHDARAIDAQTKCWMGKQKAQSWMQSLCTFRFQSPRTVKPHQPVMPGDGPGELLTDLSKKVAHGAPWHDNGWDCQRTWIVQTFKYTIGFLHLKNLMPWVTNPTSTYINTSFFSLLLGTLLSCSGNCKGCSERQPQSQQSSSRICISPSKRCRGRGPSNLQWIWFDTSITHSQDGSWWWRGWRVSLFEILRLVTIPHGSF